MIRDITIGQYYPVKSRIHSLDPRVKIICTLLFLVSLFVQSSFLGYVIATLFLGMVIYMSKVPLKYIVKGLKPIVILLMFTVVMNLFLTRGGETLLHFWIFTITEEGVRTSVFMALRLMYLVAGSSLMTFTTSPNGLMDGMEKLLNPLNKLHLPVHEVAMIMSIALRFIPILLEETDKIMKAQIARGADFESGNIIQRAKAMIPILVPLFVSAFRRETILQWRWKRAAITRRGKDEDEPLKYNGRDKAAYLITILYAAGVFAVGKFVPFQLWIF